MWRIITCNQSHNIASNKLFTKLKVELIVFEQVRFLPDPLGSACLFEQCQPWWYSGRGSLLSVRLRAVHILHNRWWSSLQWPNVCHRHTNELCFSCRHLSSQLLRRIGHCVQTVRLLFSNHTSFLLSDGSTLVDQERVASGLMAALGPSRCHLPATSPSLGFRGW